MKLKVICWQCTPHRILPYLPFGEMDGCEVALPPQVESVAEDFRLPQLECEVRMVDQKSDVTNKLLNSLKRSGWVTRVSIVPSLFTARRNACIALRQFRPSVRLSVCLSVPLSVRHTPVLCQNDGT